jgi:hypothetical protein
LVTTTRLHSPPAAAEMLGFLKKFFRDKGKDAFRVSADHEEIKKFEAKLDRALKDFNVRNLMLWGRSATVRLCLSHILGHLRNSHGGRRG